MPLPADAKERKAIPLFSGVIAYFPDALIEVAKVSKEGNDQHNPGQPLHWAKEKSTDHEDCIQRHTVDALKASDRAERIRHLRARAWRSLAALQIELEGPALGERPPNTVRVSANNRDFYDIPITPVEFCSDCGSNLEEVDHSVFCLRGIGPRVG